MKILASLRSFASTVFRRARMENDMDEELRVHIQSRASDLERTGLSRDEAERQARIEFGGYQKYKEQIREDSGAGFFEALIQDIRYGARVLRKSPAFTFVAVITLALGIGANTAIFSVVDWLILRPLPIERPNQVAFLEASYKNGGIDNQFSYPDFQRIQEQTSSIFSGTTAVVLFKMDGLSVDGKSEPMWANYVAGNFFSLLGVKPAAGRFFLLSEGKVAGADPILVLGYSYWKSRFDGDPNIVGKKVTVNGRPMTIIGVAPKGFHGVAELLDTQGYMPVAMAGVTQDDPESFLADEKSDDLRVIVRLKPGTSFERAQSVLQVVAQRLPRAKENHAAMTVLAAPLGPVSLTSGPAVRPELDLVSALFLILAGAVLVLACMNIANLCLVRIAARRREVAMRAALGATRSRLIRQLLTESLLLATLGCLGGVLLGIAASGAFGSISLHTAIPTVLDFRFDWRVFAYALAAAVLTGILVGITPALRVSRTDLNDVLHEGGRGSTAGRQRLRGVLVVAQVGGSLMLLIVAGLFVRSLGKIQHINLGFDASHVLNATIDPHEAGYQKAQAREFQKTLVARARALPGVASASLAWTVPMSYASYYDRIKIDGYQPGPNEAIPAAGLNAVSPGYFETMSIPLLQGRDFHDSDDQKSQSVAIVNQNFVDQYWHGQNPIGRHFSMLDDPSHAIEVVGVARNSRDQDIFTNNDAFFYVPLAQNYQSLTTLQLRAVSTPESLAPEVTSLVRSLDPAMPVADVQSMTTVLYGLNGFLLSQFAAFLVGALGILGLLLALVGVYGVISFAASQRTHEIGIRMALGAQPVQILKMVLGQGVVIVGIGVVCGLVAAGALARLVGNFLFGVAPLDPVTYVSASFVLGAIALLACYIPARRAMRVDPMAVLRSE
ncbi:MAG TPA: ABC transporter permease [Candidatus Acidoferrales bacterium]|nr:ABC transporter permease [Candidatus Acidoferrales bacterium]